MRYIIALLPLLLNIAAAATTSNGNSSSSTTTPSLSTSTITFPSSPTVITPGGEFIGASDSRISWSNGWKREDSPCRTPFSANKTSSPNQWMTYAVPVNATPIYLDISSNNASFSIVINNQEELDVSNSPQSCLPQRIVDSSRRDVSSITIYVNGSNNATAAGGNWSFQFNNFIIGNASLTVTGNSAGKTELRTGVTVISAVAVLLLSAIVMSFY